MIATLLGMTVAAVASAFFSGAEAALFSLSRLDLRRFRNEGTRVERIVVGLRERPRSLLATILLGNLVLNVAYYSMAAALGLRLEREGRAEQAVLVMVGSVTGLILVGEMLPKTVALHAPAAFARLVALPLLLFQRAILPVRFVLEAVAAVTTRLFAGPAPARPFLEQDDLEWLIARGGEEGRLVGSETRMIREVLELSEIRVREVMTPRVDLPLFDLGRGRDALTAKLRERPEARVLVHRGSRDEIVGAILARDLCLRPDDSLEDLVRPLPIVPESRLVESLLHEMRIDEHAAALVVDEYGGTAGLVTLEDLVEEIVGEIVDDLSGEEGFPVVAGEAGGWLVAGRLPLRELVSLIDEPQPPDAVDTVGGLIAARLGRTPRQGDVVVLGSHRLHVETLRGRGVTRVRIERDESEEA